MCDTTLCDVTVYTYVRISEHLVQLLFEISSIQCKTQHSLCLCVFHRLINAAVQITDVELLNDRRLRVSQTVWVQFTLACRHILTRKHRRLWTITTHLLLHVRVCWQLTAVITIGQQWQNHLSAPNRQMKTNATSQGSSIKDVRSEGGRLAQIQTRGGRFDCMWTSTTQHRTKACRAGVQLHGDSCHPYSDGSDCTKWTTWVARRLLSVAVWSVAWSPRIIYRWVSQLLMYADVHVRMAGGISQMWTKADKGDGNKKLPNFCGRPLWTAPYRRQQCHVRTTPSESDSRVGLGSSCTENGLWFGDTADSSSVSQQTGSFVYHRRRL